MIVVYAKDKMQIPVKNWAKTIEDSAMEQILHLSNLPFAFHHVAIMPDSHSGYGMPIGGVLATKGVVIPNAVGVDIGCVDKDTEFLSPNGWIKISDYNKEKVLQYNPTTNNGEFVTPLKYIVEPCNEFISIKTKYGVDQLLSEDHRCLIYKPGHDYSYSKSCVVTAKELEENHQNNKLGFRGRFLTSVSVDRDTYVNISNVLLRVAVMICADGRLDTRVDGSSKCYLNFKKERKINRARILLNDAAIPYKEVVNGDITTISFESPLKEKGLEQFWNCSPEQLFLIANEVIEWDGNTDEQVFYTRKKEEADFIQYAFMSSGFRAVLRVDERDSGTDYRVFRHQNTLVGIAGTPKTDITRVPSVDGKKYCFTVPSSFLVLRRNGNIFVTGNCGMCAVETSLKVEQVNQTVLKSILGMIRERIPVGFEHHKEAQDEDWMPNSIGDICVTGMQYESALKQIGTLGGGNHFIEIQADEDDCIWIMIHSGSRNLGKKVADYYNKLAVKLNGKWFSSVPKEWELAFLPIESQEAKDYMAEMQYCVEFALRNRLHMMKTIKDIFMQVIGCEFGEVINIAHNYAVWENHFGHNVIVHRKGATRARKDELGIIPGSQGTNSYIVKGLGNPESFMSCSHGAGRKMGRKAAQRTLDLAEEQRKLEGIIHSVRNASDLDEAPGSYKDIDEVMEQQRDLVAPVVKLRPLAVVKG
jgi:RNA-splicing ligase RtcB